jgi:sporulation protein YlmC with PRC-barrel domain
MNIQRGWLTDLREIGVQPEEVVDWRREAMVGAVPLTQLEPTGMFLDNLTGADVRNLQDEYLGSVSDIILDIEEGEPEYVVVARGGFLGIGEDHVLVPWENLSAAPELHVLILDMPEEQFAEAPAVDPDVAADAEWMQEYRRQTDDYWQQQREG